MPSRHLVRQLMKARADSAYLHQSKTSYTSSLNNRCPVGRMMRGKAVHRLVSTLWLVSTSISRPIKRNTVGCTTRNYPLVGRLSHTTPSWKISILGLEDKLWQVLQTRMRRLMLSLSKSPVEIHHFLSSYLVQKEESDNNSTSPPSHERENNLFDLKCTGSK